MGRRRNRLFAKTGSPCLILVVVTNRVRFGMFDFDPMKRELRHEGSPVRLQPQPAQVLSVLIEHAGEVVTRDQLRQAVWGTETFVDFDRGLNFCIAQIRSALGDSAESPRFVRTIPKQGYQFVAPLGPAVSPTMTPPLNASSRSVRKYVLVAAAVVLAGGLVAAISAVRRPITNIAVARFDNETGSADLDGFVDGLTDTVVADLTSGGGARYGIIGNAAILRRPRSERDLMAINSSLKVRYVVLGQVQRSATNVRVLAHLIRLPEQTHLWVVRLDHDISDPLQAEKELGRLISEQFLRHLAAS